MRAMSPAIRLGFLVLCGWLASMEAASAVTTIGLGFLVDERLGGDDARRRAARAKLDRWVDEVNAAYRASLVELKAEIVDVRFLPIAEREAVSILDGMAAERGDFAGLFAHARQSGADFTIAVDAGLLIRGKRGCGRAYGINKTAAEIADPRRALVVIDFACRGHTLAHELGHLMGLNHGGLVDQCDPGKGHRTAVAPHANGYALGNCDGKPQAGEFGDIMVGGWMKSINGDGHGSLPIFSNPRLRDTRCGSRQICGDPATGDAARVLNEFAPLYAGHAPPVAGLGDAPAP
jgi:hypothetical protein